MITSTRGGEAFGSGSIVVIIDVCVCLCLIELRYLSAQTGVRSSTRVLPDQSTTPNKLGHYGPSAGSRAGCAEQDAGEIDLSPRKYNSRLSDLSIKLSKYSMPFNSVTN